MQPSSKSATDIVNSLLDHSAASSLGTIGISGAPFVSLVNVARYSRTSIVMLLSGLAQHTRNLLHDERSSLLIASEIQQGVDPLTSARVTLSGQAARLSRNEDDAERACMLKRHPKAAMYAELGDFAIFKFEITDAHLVAGFGKIQTIAADQL